MCELYDLRKNALAAKWRSGELSGGEMTTRRNNLAAKSPIGQVSSGKMSSSEKSGGETSGGERSGGEMSCHRPDHQKVSGLTACIFIPSNQSVRHA